MKNYYVLRLLTALLVGAVVAVVAGGSLAQERSESVAAAPAASGGYRIGPGDTLQVFVWGHADLSVTVPVRPDGRVTTPLIKDLEAAGKTPTQLESEMETVLSEFIRSPEVNVIVQQFVGAFADQVRVLGQAAEPRAVPYREGMTLLDVMIAVGGLTRFAAGNRAEVVRNVDGRTEKRRVKLHDLMNRGRIEQNMPMQPGDLVIIPEARF